MNRTWLLRGGGLLLLLLLPWVLRDRLSLTIPLVIGLHAVLAIGLTLLAGQAGQVSLGQAAFYGIGAYTAALLTVRLGWDPWVALGMAVLVATSLAYALGAPVMVLRGHYLVLGTLALNVVVEVILRNWQDLTGGANGLSGVPPLHLGPLGELRGTLPYYYLTWGLVLLSLRMGHNLLRSRAGRALAAIRASEVAAVSLGIPPTRYKLQLFAYSAACAAVAGGLYAYELGFVSPSPFGFELSIAVLVMSVLGGIHHLPGAVLGAAIVTLLRELLRSLLPQLFRGGASAEYEAVVYGLLLAATVIAAPTGLWPLLTYWTRRPAQELRIQLERPVPPPPAQVPTDPIGPAHGSDPAVEVRSVTKRFGGLVAVDGLSFTVRPGEIYAIIGPNGAGKTTVLNLITGLLRPTTGTFALFGFPVHTLPPERIASLGVARTFQTPRVVWDLTVLDNVRLGMHLHLRTGFLTSLLGLNRGEEVRSTRQAEALLDRLGLAAHAHEIAANLPFGSLRLLELARALALRPRLLLLDEPASGLSGEQRGELARLIQEIREEGTTVVLVEHDVGMVLQVADRVLVLHQGRCIAEGSPAVVRAHPEVISAYLGPGGVQVATPIPGDLRSGQRAQA
ncbi:MAG: branched-chain amino acid ABC transporter ATP-binding protein/permease [Armatimonadota bacterium]|nr:branched-chain amino acid ABC transporter ATP-binding protein/permease [Armatimonadota bacterium]MDR7562721.1 branched-chain amino acid ABC transporter ATP-binding protein/permease [Armatimonadota bacterium]MDR7601020.1 branched-chain amino acid ABC transporter ATP-binding protein/permease [Armatimonadota bacterium]